MLGYSRLQKDTIETTIEALLLFSFSIKRTKHIPHPLISIHHRTMKSISFTLTMMLSLLTASNAFVSHPTIAFVTREQSKTTGMFLTPDQATDLEACAYDLMKEAEAKSKHQHMDAIEVTAGPVRWCRDRLLAFTSGKVNQASAVSKLP